MKICIILNHPTTPENIGAAARALKTMGFSDLRLVDPCDHLSDRAHWLAHGSEDILESAQVFNSITAAISDIDFLIGTSAKKRPRPLAGAWFRRYSRIGTGFQLDHRCNIRYRFSDRYIGKKATIKE